jgi:hypothetical protein
MAGIDLREIHFRAHEQGDEANTPSQFPTAGSSTSKVSLAAIKFRAKELGDDEN